MSDSETEYLKRAFKRKAIHRRASLNYMYINGKQFTFDTYIKHLISLLGDTDSKIQHNVMVNLCVLENSLVLDYIIQALVKEDNKTIRKNLAKTIHNIELEDDKYIQPLLSIYEKIEEEEEISSIGITLGILSEKYPKKILPKMMDWYKKGKSKRLQQKAIYVLGIPKKKAKKYLSDMIEGLEKETHEDTVIQTINTITNLHDNPEEILQKFINHENKNIALNSAYFLLETDLNNTLATEMFVDSLSQNDEKFIEIVLDYLLGLFEQYWDEELESVPYLISELYPRVLEIIKSSKSANIRISALKTICPLLALKEINEQATSIILKIIKETSDLELKTEAIITTMCLFPNPYSEVLPLLEEYITPDNPKPLRLITLDTIGWIGDSEPIKVMPILIDCLSVKDDDIKKQILTIFTRLDWDFKKLFNELVDLLEKVENPQIKELLLSLLDSTHDDITEVVPLISSCFQIDYDDMKISTVKKLGEIKTSESLRELLAFRKQLADDIELSTMDHFNYSSVTVDDNFWIKKIVRDELEVFRQPKFLDLLLTAFEETNDLFVQQWITNTLMRFKELDGKVKSFFYEQVLEHTDWTVRSFAAFGIKNLKTHTQDEVLSNLAIQMHENDEEKIRERAAWAIGRVGSNIVIPNLIQIIQQDDNKRVRREAIEAMEFIGCNYPDEVVEPLIFVLENDKDVYCRYRAIRALKRIKEKAEPAIPNLIKIYSEDTRKNIQMIVSSTLKMIVEELKFKSIDDLIRKYK